MIELIGYIYKDDTVVIHPIIKRTGENLLYYEAACGWWLLVDRYRFVTDLGAVPLGKRVCLRCLIRGEREKERAEITEREIVKKLTGKEVI